jgi:hypothetical protein
MAKRDDCCSLVPDMGEDGFTMIVPGTVVRGREAALAWIAVYEQKQKNDIEEVQYVKGPQSRIAISQRNLQKATRARRIVASNVATLNFKEL